MSRQERGGGGAATGTAALLPTAATHAPTHAPLSSCLQEDPHQGAHRPAEVINTRRQCQYTDQPTPTRRASPTPHPAHLHPPDATDPHARHRLLKRRDRLQRVPGGQQ